LKAGLKSEYLFNMTTPKKCRIGLTGGIGCGKSTAARLFQDLGAAIVDADALSRALTASGGLAIDKIRRAFGAEAISPDGAMNREKMRALVFSDNAAKTRLEAILHPMIRQQTDQAMDEAQGAYVLLDFPLLLESNNWKERVHQVVVVDCPVETQIERVIQRSQLAEAQIRAIMAQQVSRDFRRTHADHILDNSGTPDSLKPQVEALHQRLQAMVCYS
jgi:dephospho-CoA kinase